MTKKSTTLFPASTSHEESPEENGHAAEYENGLPDEELRSILLTMGAILTCLEINGLLKG